MNKQFLPEANLFILRTRRNGWMVMLCSPDHHQSVITFIMFMNNLYAGLYYVLYNLFNILKVIPTRIKILLQYEIIQNKFPTAVPYHSNYRPRYTFHHPHSIRFYMKITYNFGDLYTPYHLMFLDVFGF